MIKNNRASHDCHPTMNRLWLVYCFHDDTLPAPNGAWLWRKIVLDLGSLLLDGSLQCGDGLEVSEKGVHQNYWDALYAVEEYFR